MFGLFGRRRRRAAQTSDMEGPQVSIRSMPSETAARQAAEGGSSADMNRLGVQLKTKGREDEAMEWFRRAAEAGNNDAMANLATSLMAKGRNKEAAEWFRRAGGPLGEALAQRLAERPDDPQDR